MTKTDLDILDRHISIVGSHVFAVWKIADYAEKECGDAVEAYRNKCFEHASVLATGVFSAYRSAKRDMDFIEYWEGSDSTFYRTAQIGFNSAKKHFERAARIYDLCKNAIKG